MFVFAVGARARVRARALRVEKPFLSVTASPATSHVSSQVEKQQFHKRDQVFGSSAAPSLLLWVKPAGSMHSCEVAGAP